MTVSSTNTRVETLTDGVAASYVIPFGFSGPDGLTVVLYNNTTGAETALTFAVDYNLGASGVDLYGNPSYDDGGAVIPIDPADFPSGYTMIAYGDPPLTQAVAMVQNDPLPVHDYIERPLDKLTWIAKRSRDIVTRTIRLSDGEPESSQQLPTIATRAGKYWAWDALGNLIASAAAISTSAMSVFFETLIGAADAAALRALIFAAKTGDVGLTGITMKTARLLGRFTAGNGAIEEVIIGSGLTLSGGGTLSATGAMAAVSGSPFSVTNAASLVVTGLTGGNWYDLIIENIIPITNNVTIYMDVSTDGGSTWQVTGYCWGLYGVTPATTAVLTASSSGTAMTVSVSQYNLQPLNGFMKLQPFSGRCWMNGQISTLLNTGNTSVWALGLTWFGSGTVDAVRFRASSGNITGTVRAIKTSL